MYAEGRDPRLVLDSTICNVNPRCHLPERVALPTASDIRLTTQTSDPHGAFLGAGLDIKAAHKQVAVHPDEQGLLLFAFEDVLYHYRVCHFGARFSAYWWQRLGAFLLRHLRGLLAFAPHKAWLYVDDLLMALWRANAIAIIFFSAIGAQMSWKKAQLQDNITWCGWDLNFAMDTIQLTQNKLDKLLEQLQALRDHKKASRKSLEKTTGLLVWATSISPHLRPFMAPLYSDLHSPPGSQYAIHANLWQAFRSALTNNLHLQQPVLGIHMPQGCKLLEYSNQRLHTKADLPEVPKTSKTQWVRASNPEATHTTLRRESLESIDWTFAPERPLALPSPLMCLAAADACAERSTVGIGGWIITKSHVAWFSETWTMTDLRQTWPFLTKTAQSYISSFEALAQFALLQTAYRLVQHSHYQFSLPTGSDNTAAESSLNKLFTTTWPLCHFLKAVASWAHAKGIALQVSHIPGKKNDWADELSRNNLHRFQHRPGQRVRFQPVDLAQIQRQLTLHPPDAPWPPEHRAAQRK